MMAMTGKVQKRIEVSKSHASIYDLTGGDVANVYKRGRRNMNKDFGDQSLLDYSGVILELRPGKPINLTQFE